MKHGKNQKKLRDNKIIKEKVSDKGIQRTFQKRDSLCLSLKIATKIIIISTSGLIIIIMISEEAEPTFLFVLFILLSHYRNHFQSSSGTTDIFISGLVAFLTAIRVYIVICAVSFYNRIRKEPPGSTSSSYPLPKCKQRLS